MKTLSRSKKKNKVNLKSILEPMVKEVELHTSTISIAEIKQQIVVKISNTKINDKDKLKLLQDIARQQDGPSLIKFLYNAILKYSGFGVVKVNYVTAKVSVEEMDAE